MTEGIQPVPNTNVEFNPSLNTCAPPENPSRDSIYTNIEKNDGPNLNAEYTAENMSAIMQSPEFQALSAAEDTLEIFNEDGSINGENIVYTYTAQTDSRNELISLLAEAGKINPDDITVDEDGQTQVGNFDEAGNGGFSLIDGTEIWFADSYYADDGTYHYGNINVQTPDGKKYSAGKG